MVCTHMCSSIFMNLISDGEKKDINKTIAASICGTRTRMQIMKMVNGLALFVLYDLFPRLTAGQGGCMHN